jgi:hypothetical protein
MNSSYTVEHHPYGILIFGQLPVEDFCALAKSMPPNSALHDGIAKHYRALACMSPGDKARQWEAEIEAEVAKLPPQERFLKGTKTGTSYVTIFVALTDSPQLKAQAQSLHPEIPRIPSDSSDFARCHYLLTLMPAWRARLAEVGATFPGIGWQELAGAWGQLEKHFEAGQHKELYDLLCQIRETTARS